MKRVFWHELIGTDQRVSQPDSQNSFASMAFYYTRDCGFSEEQLTKDLYRAYYRKPGPLPRNWKAQLRGAINSSHGRWPSAVLRAFITAERQDPDGAFEVVLPNNIRIGCELVGGE